MKRGRSPELWREANGEEAERPREAYPRGLEVPDGWMDCPPLGTEIREVRIVPVKAPLSTKFNSVIPPSKRFTPADVVSELQTFNLRVGLVLDLTNTYRYYDSEEWEQMGVQYLKIHCRGRGEVPEPEAVNRFCWEVASFHSHEENQGSHVVVHCTHGFNRTGYMISNYMVRMGYPLANAVRTFATHRSPGIYKDDYIQALFKYNHFRRPKNLHTPARPAWKEQEEDSPEPEDQNGSNLETGGPQEAMAHDDLLGEAVSPEEADTVQRTVMGAMMEQQHPGSGARDGQQWEGRLYFPGSQPVSLARSNLELLKQRRYYVTWKADGTRYMLLICKWGAYLIDRSFTVRRVQMRFPKSTEPAAPGQPRRAGGPHHFTLLDGEMVVDEDIVNDSVQRRYLAYDLMMLEGKSLMRQPFKVRFSLIKKEITQPRSTEKQIMGSPAAKFLYLYDEEPFHVRVKEFWPMTAADKVLNNFIPKLSHESDGLILQGWDDPYITGTCKELLKWKFAHLNSVDFQLDATPEGKLVLLLLETRGGQRYLKPLDGAKIDLGELDSEELIGKAIEHEIVLEGQLNK
ncbi:hypothetical protein WJX73_010638 [Symbiochloris irregularis]|uniref:Tyrosine specific protein phosphatases domain-containing protein n=1 Tax=Symbiochloris irregularis TaxID=706552 RepID=A0AAW1P7L1_9CHLO